MLYFYLAARRTAEARRPYPESMREAIQKNAGIFPNTDSSLDAWCEAYLEALPVLTGLAAGWYVEYDSDGVSIA